MVRFFKKFLCIKFGFVGGFCVYHLCSFILASLSFLGGCSFHQLGCGFIMFLVPSVIHFLGLYYYYFSRLILPFFVTAFTVARAEIACSRLLGLVFFRIRWVGCFSLCSLVPCIPFA